MELDSYCSSHACNALHHTGCVICRRTNAYSSAGPSGVELSLDALGSRLFVRSFISEVRHTISHVVSRCACMRAPLRCASCRHVSCELVAEYE
jgi:hypothetical protein